MRDRGKRDRKAGWPRDEQRSKEKKSRVALQRQLNMQEQQPKIGNPVGTEAQASGVMMTMMIMMIMIMKWSFKIVINNNNNNNNKIIIIDNIYHNKNNLPLIRGILITLPLIMS